MRGPILFYESDADWDIFSNVMSVATLINVYSGKGLCFYLQGKRIDGISTSEAIFQTAKGLLANREGGSFPGAALSNLNEKRGVEGRASQALGQAYNRHAANTQFHAAISADSALFREIRSELATDAVLSRRVFASKIDKTPGHETFAPTGGLTLKEQIMYEVLLMKFTQFPALANTLLKTGTAELIENAGRNDGFWGNGPNGDGANALGIALMRVRHTLKQELSVVGKISVRTSFSKVLLQHLGLDRESLGRDRAPKDEKLTSAEFGLYPQDAQLNSVAKIAAFQASKATSDAGPAGVEVWEVDELPSVYLKHLLANKLKINVNALSLRVEKRSETFFDLQVTFKDTATASRLSRATGQGSASSQLVTVSQKRLTYSCTQPGALLYGETFGRVRKISLVDAIHGELVGTIRKRSTAHNTARLGAPSGSTDRSSCCLM